MHISKWRHMVSVTGNYSIMRRHRHGLTIACRTLTMNASKTTGTKVMLCIFGLGRILSRRVRDCERIGIKMTEAICLQFVSISAAAAALSARSLEHLILSNVGSFGYCLFVIPIFRDFIVKPHRPGYPFQSTCAILGTPEMKRAFDEAQKCR